MKMSVWRRMARLLLAFSALSAVTEAALAQIPPDQRRQMRQEMREQWRQMPQDDRRGMAAAVVVAGSGAGGAER